MDTTNELFIRGVVRAIEEVELTEGDYIQIIIRNPILDRVTKYSIHETKRH